MFRGLLPQDAVSPAPPPAPAADGDVLAWLLDVAGRPGVVESLLAVLLCGIGLLVFARLWRVVAGVRSRALLQDYLLGVEQALAGDLAGARARLERVLQADPENHYARLCYGKVLAAQGEHAHAHKHHLYLQSAFAVQSADNELHLARALAAVGRPADAAAVAERALAAEPTHVALLEFVFRSRLQAGDHEAAVAAGRRWLQQVPRALRDAAARDVAGAAATAGLVQLRRRDAARAATLLQEATSLCADAPGVRLLGERVRTAGRGAAATVAGWLDAPRAAAGARGSAAGRGPGGVPGTSLVAAGAAGAVLPAAAGIERVEPVPIARHGAVLDRLRPLLPAGRWSCGSCLAPLDGARTTCPACGAVDSAVADEPQLFAAVDAPTLLVDAFERNTAHVRRTVRAALDAAPGDAAAREALVDLGDAAVPELLAQAAQRGGEDVARAVELLRELGPGCLGVLFQTAAAQEKNAAVAALVGRVVQGFDRGALPHVEALFATARPRLRKVLIEYFLGLADPVEFQLVLERFPPLEILQAIDKVEAEVLRRFLQSLPAQHFVVDVLLLQDAFYRDAEILAAIPGAPQPHVLEDVLRRRGATRSLVRELLRRLGDESLRPVARRLLLGFGERALQHVLAAFGDRDCDAASRAELASLLVEFGDAAVGALCACFGPEPAALDDDVLAVLAAIGDDAVEALAGAYARPGLLERVTAGLLRRGTNRRTQIVRALATIGTARAEHALRGLRESETDPNLKLRLQQALHRIEETGHRAAAPSRAPGTADEGDGGRERERSEPRERQREDGRGQVG